MPRCSGPTVLCSMLEGSSSGHTWTSHSVPFLGHRLERLAGKRGHNAVNPGAVGSSSAALPSTQDLGTIVDRGLPLRGGRAHAPAPATVRCVIPEGVQRIVICRVSKFMRRFAVRRTGAHQVGSHCASPRGGKSFGAWVIHPTAALGALGPFRGEAGAPRGTGRWKRGVGPAIAPAAHPGITVRGRARPPAVFTGSKTRDREGRRARMSERGA